MFHEHVHIHAYACSRVHVCVLNCVCTISNNVNWYDNGDLYLMLLCVNISANVRKFLCVCTIVHIYVFVCGIVFVQHY